MAVVILERDVTMNRLFKTLVVSATLAATAVVSVGTASAEDFRWRRHHNNGDAVIAGVAGLAVGAILGSTLAAPRPPRHYIEDDPIYADPAPIYAEPAPVYRVKRIIVRQDPYIDQGPLRPWSRAWLRYCSERYRSFDPGTGTYVGYDGQERFCQG